jgi:hypothetical protein
LTVAGGKSGDVGETVIVDLHVWSALEGRGRTGEGAKRGELRHSEMSETRYDTEREDGVQIDRLAER